MEELLFPYRFVLQYADGRTEELEDELVGFWLDQGNVVDLLEVTPRFWRVERIEDEIDFAPTAAQVEADPSLWCGTAYLRPNPDQRRSRWGNSEEAKV